jgi:hypothetical protein
MSLKFKESRDFLPKTPDPKMVDICLFDDIRLSNHLTNDRSGKLSRGFGSRRSRDGDSAGSDADGPENNNVTDGRGEGAMD